MDQGGGATFLSRDTLAGGRRLGRGRPMGETSTAARQGRGRARIDLSGRSKRADRPGVGFGRGFDGELRWLVFRLLHPLSIRSSPAWAHCFNLSQASHRGGCLSLGFPLG